jgi:uncharacterized membrane protein
MTNVMGGSCLLIPNVRRRIEFTSEWQYDIGAVLLAGVAPLFGFTAIALGLVGYVTTLFKLGAIFTILWARLFLGEGQARSRLLGACVMVIGGVLVAM